MIDRFEVFGHDDPRPDTGRVIFCDGAGGNLFRAETDLELSHWRPNRDRVGIRRPSTMWPETMMAAPPT